MIVHVIKFNSGWQPMKTEKYKATEVKIQPAGIIEIKHGDSDNIKYIRFLTTDFTNILIKEEEPSAESK